MAVNAVADAWLSRIPAEERAEQFQRLFEFRSGSYDRMEDFFRRLSPEFTGPDLDRLLHQCVSVFASVSSPPKSALDAWAKRVLEEVHTLASAYGWAQSEILSMSAARRRRYVAMVVETG